MTIQSYSHYSGFVVIEGFNHSNA